MKAQSAQQSAASAKAEDSLLVAIIEQIGNKKGVDPLDLPPLQTAVDVDALTALVNHRRDTPEIEVQFTYVGYQITVTGAGAISVQK